MNREKFSNPWVVVVFCLTVGKHLPVWVVASEYLDLYDLHPTCFAHAKAHMFKLLHHILQLEENVHLRDAVTQTSYVEEFRGILDQIKKKYDSCTGCPFEMEMTTLPVPVYMSQPHFRKDRLAKQESSHEKANINVTNDSEKKKRPFDHVIQGDEQVSKNMLRKLLKKQRRESKEPGKCRQEKVRLELCIKCSNPRGMTCNWQLCKPCCKLKREGNPSITCDNHCRRIRCKGQTMNVIEETSLINNCGETS